MWGARRNPRGLVTRIPHLGSETLTRASKLAGDPYCAVCGRNDGVLWGTRSCGRFGGGGAVHGAAGAAGGMAGGGDAGVLEQAGLGAGHALDGAAEHGLDGGVGVGGVEGAFDGDDVGDVGLVVGHPAANGCGEIVEMLDHESAAGVVAVGADAVEGEDEGVAELVDVAAEPEGGGVGGGGGGEG